MTDRRWLLIIVAIAALHGAFFIWYQRPDWSTRWPDQEGYRKLGAALATTGRFTRYPQSPTYVPEALRTPGYPAFVAAVYAIAGTRQVTIAIAQTGLFILICGLVFAVARDVAGRRVAITAAAATALYPPLPYFGALVMTEVWTTFLLTLGVWLCFRVRRTRRASDAVLAGLVIGLTALSRPVFVLLPFALFGVTALAWRREQLLRQWLIAASVAVLALVPWFTYNYVNFHRVTISPGGGFGRAIWEGTWQGRWSDRLHNELTHTAERLNDRSALDAAVRQLAATAQSDPGPMLTYVHQWQDIRRIWDAPIDPYERGIARIQADSEYMRIGIANATKELAPHLWRRLSRGLLVLWAGQIPIRYSDINDAPIWIVRVCRALQVALMALAVYGFARLSASGAAAGALLLATPIVYITAVHWLLLTEARQSLPAVPVLLTLAAAAVAQVQMNVKRPAPARPAGQA
jgi:4-amino-4-deoxy-L-arabinose transferase-like glycosyltransferase